MDLLNKSLPVDVDTDTMESARPAPAPWDEQDEPSVWGGLKEWEARQQACASWPEWLELQEIRRQLPVADARQELLAAIRLHSVTIVAGATGSGKTTQVPQFVLEDAMLYDEPVNVYVTEPRRISAMSVATRVSEELGDDGVNDAWCGYHVRLEKRVGPKTRLVYMTTGVLLRRLSSDRALQSVTHVFIDEVHERSADVDLLVVLLKRILSAGSKLKVILMSATLETEKLKSYFGSIDRQLPICVVPGRMFPVQHYFLEDIVEETGYTPDPDSWYAKRAKYVQSKQQQVTVTGRAGRTQTQWVGTEEEVYGWSDNEILDDPAYSEETKRTLLAMDHHQVNCDLIERTIDLIMTYDEQGAILVFLPGMPDISRLSEQLHRSPVYGDTQRFVIMPLHSSLSTQEHKQVFVQFQHKVKIVLSTNIAETGVTLPDVVFVIDAGRSKQQRYRESTGTSSLVEQFVSRSEATQRQGRAGRVRPGHCFKLYTRRRFARWQEQPVPELLRCSLAQLSLGLLASGLQPLEVLQECLDPPPTGRVEEAVQALRSAGAVIAPDAATLRITPLGRKLALLPCDVGLGKFLVYSALLGCLAPALTIAAALSSKPAFSQPFSEHKRAEANKAHRTFATDPPSDHYAIANSFEQWRKNGKSDRWCRQLFMSIPGLKLLDSSRNDLRKTLDQAGLLAAQRAQPAASNNLVSAAMVAGFGALARCDPPQFTGDKFPSYTAGTERLHIHPTSLVGGADAHMHQDHHFIVYYAKMRTNRVYIKDASFVSPMACALFGKELQAFPRECVMTFGPHWQALYASYRTTALLRQVRLRIDRVVRGRLMGMPDPDEAKVCSLVEYLVNLPPVV